ncbi:MAG: hypothetical protein QME49_03625 [bacterium]|nr:hypothetical protein [bacterium]
MSEHDMDYELIKKAVKQALLEEGYSLRDSEMELGEKWVGGELIIKPQSDTLAEKKIPLEAFFHKIIMIRDRLRVLEQKINANPKLGDDEKIEMQQYITRIYGSLTTFNLLFKRKSGWFVGEKGEKS